jgi:hypothetical protein
MEVDAMNRFGRVPASQCVGLAQACGLQHK